ncbi:hypothetical protein AG1IA_08675 [Rhizoctonia solani AG-1 IA]|uniref:Uncharacterized protein n=1 Tax=Thanatephorus cucumeris (strain AG1-IA) TaxID=983506 RepID=L8WHA7_THACA|nr:hypothetical protein AG1IA_08675 [Rhizoctonia solani AG-1 IA]
MARLDLHYERGCGSELAEMHEPGLGSRETGTRGGRARPSDALLFSQVPSQDPDALIGLQPADVSLNYQHFKFSRLPPCYDCLQGWPTRLRAPLASGCPRHTRVPQTI